MLLFRLYPRLSDFICVPECPFSRLFISTSFRASRRKNMPYAAKDYAKLIGMTGFSETLLKNHFTLYQGYVTNTNKALDTLDQMAKDGKTATPEFAEIKRRLGWEFNGMRLHEYYFENLGGKGGIDQSGDRKSTRLNSSHHSISYAVFCLKKKKL